MMPYVSTRGADPPRTFSPCVLSGLARDGGLLLPRALPSVSDRLAAWRGLSYADLAVEVMLPFVDLPRLRLAELVSRSYAVFDIPDAVRLIEVGDMFLLELFHGPTLAFKDIALQFLGNLFETLLEESGERMTIVGATSGDTGSAAIHGARGRSGLSIFIMHPHNRVSRVQALQMTTVLDANVHNIAVRGTFDDCQNLLKRLFGDLAFRDEHKLGAINSINWARVLAQVVYYFYAAFKAQERTGAARVRFSVPTGNFGDVFAGYLAARMGAPIERLIVATNENDILSRFFNEGVYCRRRVHETPSPSMDIQVASNFERYLYYRVGSDPEVVCRLMDEFSRTGSLRIPADRDRGETLFQADACGAKETLDTMADVYRRTGYAMDPHTAVGYAVARRLPGSAPTICLATAHPAKFGETVELALNGKRIPHPRIEALEGLPTRVEIMDADENALKRFVAERALAAGEPFYEPQGCGASFRMERKS